MVAYTPLHFKPTPTDSKRRQKTAVPQISDPWDIQSKFFNRRPRGGSLRVPLPPEISPSEFETLALA